MHTLAAALMSAPPLPPSDDISDLVRRALTEDIGAGDLTAALLPPDAVAQAGVITREDAVLAGCAWFEEVYRQLDAGVRVTWLAHDADTVRAGQTLCRVQGPVRALLSGERSALNFLQFLSGTATRTRVYVDAIRGTRAVLLDTRKTVPALRRAQKYAVLCGGASNHRIGLYDGILIKENHILAAGSIGAALDAARAGAPANVIIEVEVENLAQLKEALAAGATHILLDNFDVAGMRAAVAENRGRAKLEASGGITLANIRAIAETGVDFISTGDVTKNVKAVDLSMRFVSQRTDG